MMMVTIMLMIVGGLFHKPSTFGCSAFHIINKQGWRIQSSLVSTSFRGTTTTNHIPSLGSIHARTTTTTRTTTSLFATTASLKKYIEILIDGSRHLTTEETEEAFNLILQGADEVQVGSLLTLLRARNETPNEVAGMVKAMNNACKRVIITSNNDPNDPNQHVKLLDIVGTGGDGADTINISTASVVLAAACGCIVAKIGNRSVSSRCGSADVLEALGVKVDLQPNELVECVKQINIAFMFAPIHHPSMKYVAPVRKKLGVRTCFNILGPMTNAAGAQHAVIGVFQPELMSIMANALIEVQQIEHVVIIHGTGGLDEISPLGPSKILEIKNIGTTDDDNKKKKYEVKEYEFDPLSVGIERCELIDLKGGDPEENAERFRQVLQGGNHMDAKRDAIILNAGFGNYVYGLSPSIEEGIALAKTTLQSGKAFDLLQKWITVSQEIAATAASANGGAVVIEENQSKIQA